ncbi:subtilisin inhibitor-like [Prauserella shujinwangii]|uniref:Subtilisin inhibitor-like n=2 Tax=Prauserella shujinwangii TaxID=1453103 RepID=A0A2T0LTT1_9PSEU|nr:subtilisin inhibitor-like [Prauserella shujinwangii]
MFAESLAACAATLLCASGPAVSPSPDSVLHLTMTPPNGATRAAVLVCDPAAGTHPKPYEACSAIERADGELADLPRRNQACPMIYSPVVAEAHGWWRGERVDFRASYSNACVADAESSGLFGF